MQDMCFTSHFAFLAYSMPLFNLEVNRVPYNAQYINVFSIVY